jgi:CDP-diacylglycerol--serine O-phosphatidyltransferase
MRKGIYLLPNAITLCGMFAGFFSIIASLNGKFTVAAWAIVLAGVFDGLDGWVARMTNTSSKFGVELDSLADVISFGVAPAVLSFTWALSPFGRVGWAVAFLYTACGALRLARFNVQKETEEKKTFTGMPIPAAAGVISAIVIFYANMKWVPERSFFVLAIVILISFLMVSTLRFHSLKEINMRERKPFFILVAMVFVIAVFYMHPELTMFSIAIAYISLGLVENAYLVLVKKEKL